MPFDFRLPDLGEGITEGEIRKWLISTGTSVEEHQTVLEIETDKAIVEVPSPRRGRVQAINKREGDIVKVGEVLMTIADDAETAIAPDGVSRPSSVSVVGVLPEEEPAGVLAPPAVRTLARELGVQIESLRGTGPAGSITAEDVRKAAQPAAPSEDQYGPAERIALKGLRRTIARNLKQSQNATVSVTGMEEADVTELWELREREKGALLDRGIHLTFMPFFIKAVHHALSEHPALNASVDDAREEIVLKKYFNVGVAVDTPDGLMVPVIRDADRKTIIALAEELQSLGQKARERKIKLEELRGSTFTITNYGHFGTLFATPVINYPDVAILGTGRIADKPWVKDGRIVIRKILPLSLTFDHRVTDGVEASRFMAKVISYLEDPALLFIESA